MASSQPSIQGEVLNFRRTRLTYKNVQLVWNLALEAIRLRNPYGSYSHVLWQREEMHWVSDLHLDKFKDPWAVYGLGLAALSRPCERPPVYESPGYIGDKILLVGREAAMSFFKLYDLVNCGTASSKLDRVEHP
ncbi:unnamed protein product, partial [Symbiodinium pilosum]